MGKVVGTAIFGLVAAVGGAIGFYFWSGNLERAQREAFYQDRIRHADARTEQLQQKNEELKRQRRLLAEKLTRLGAERVVATVEVVRQVIGENGQVLMTKGVFEEVSRKRGLLSAKTFEVPGDTVHFDALLIQFPTDSVAEGDPLRGQTLHLFRRIYGDTQAPTEGLYFGTNRDIPDIYRVDDDPGEYERQLWDGFWEMAMDPRRAEQHGVKVAMGQGVYTRLVPGKIYELIIQSNGGLIVKAANVDGPTSQP